MRMTAVLADSASRLTADLRTRFPRVEVIVTANAGGELEISVKDSYHSWGEYAAWLDLPDEDDYDDLEREEFVLRTAREVADNLWPDELTEPWPLCPRHPDHPLSPSLVGTRASWMCSRDRAIAVPIGTLGDRIDRSKGPLSSSGPPN
jgi:hypothetical protein